MRNKIIGGVVGGTVGFIIGAIIVDRLYPEYYMPGEDFPYPGVPDYQDPGAKHDGELPLKNTKFVLRPAKKPLNFRPVDYTKYGEKRPLSEYEEQQKAAAENLAEEGDVLVNIFDSVDDDSVYEDYSDLGSISYEEYLGSRDESEPYFLSHDEFEAMEEDDPDMPITNLTYYTEDDVVVSSDDNRPLDIDPSKLIGDDALSPPNSGIFGNPEDVVCIYNPELNGVYRVISIHGSYEEEVAGLMVVKSPKRHKPSEEEDDE